MTASSLLFPSATVLAAAVPVALLVDRCWGEPPMRWHPVVWMGHALAALGRWAAPPAATVAAGPGRGWPFGRGMLAWCALAGMVGALAWALQAALLQAGHVVAVLLLGVLLKPMLAWRMLHDEVAAVERALGASLVAGRERLSRLCSRDVSALRADEVRETAIETLAENLNDSVVAPVFWFLLAGLPGAAVYRLANTADAMWGYRGERDGRVWTWAGKWAARADDVLSWLPARLTALLLWLASWGGVAGRGAWAGLPAQAACTPSPNGGWPMATMALALGVRLGKPGVYVLNAAGAVPSAADVQRALAWAGRTVWLLAGCCGLAAAVSWAGMMAVWT